MISKLENNAIIVWNNGSSFALRAWDEAGDTLEMMPTCDQKGNSIDSEVITEADYE